MYLSTAFISDGNFKLGVILFQYLETIGLIILLMNRIYYEDHVYVLLESQKMLLIFYCKMTGGQRLLFNSSSIWTSDQEFILFNIGININYLFVMEVNFICEIFTKGNTGKGTRAKEYNKKKGDTTALNSI